jgi:purine-nucleoside phosphorylase
VHRPGARPATRAPAPPVLIVAAFPPELKALAAALRTRAQDGGAPVARAAVGVGLVEAAAGAARTIALLEPRAVVLIGTAGRYPTAAGAPPIGAVALVRRARLASATVAAEDAYLPGLIPAAADTDPRLRRELGRGQRLPSLDVACPLGITRGARTAAALAAATGAALENLEAFAVARACDRAGVPFAAVLGITNDVGPRAHAQWQAHAAAAAAAACAVVRRWLDSERASPRAPLTAPTRRPSPRPADRRRAPG